MHWRIALKHKQAYASSGLSSALSVEIKDEIKIKYGCPERANLLRKVLE
jgi:hypothetical protein